MIKEKYLTNIKAVNEMVLDKRLRLNYFRDIKKCAINDEDINYIDFCELEEILIPLEKECWNNA